MHEMKCKACVWPLWVDFALARAATESLEGFTLNRSSEKGSAAWTRVASVVSVATVLWNK